MGAGGHDVAQVHDVGVPQPPHDRDLFLDLRRQLGALHHLLVQHLGWASRKRLQYARGLQVQLTPGAVPARQHVPAEALESGAAHAGGYQLAYCAHYGACHMASEKPDPCIMRRHWPETLVRRCCTLMATVSPLSTC